MSILQFLTFPQKYIRKYCLLFSVVSLFLCYTFPILSIPIASFNHELLAATALLFLGLALSIQISTWQIGWLPLLLLALSVVPVVQWQFGTIFFFGDAFLVFCCLSASAFAWACGSNVASSGLRKDLFLKVAFLFFFLSFVNVFFAVNQYFNLALIKDFLVAAGARPFGNLGQPNNFASVLIVSFLCCWYLFEKLIFSRKIYYLLILYICVGLVLAQSRTTLLVMLCVMLFYVLFHKKIAFRMRAYDFIWVCVCYIFCIVVLPLIKLELSPGGAGDGLRELTGHYSSRLSIWYESILAIVNGPLRGYGWNQIGVAQALVQSDLESVVHFRHAHNLFLDLLLYNGPVIGTVLIVAIAAFAWRSFIHCRTIEGWVALAIIGAVFTHSMVEFPLHYAYFLLPIAFLVGLLDAPPSTGNSHFLLPFSYPSWFNIPIVFMGVILLVVIWRDYAIVHKEHFKLGIELTGVFGRDLRNEKTGGIMLLTQRREYLNFGRAKAIEGMSNEDIEWMKKVSHRFASPYHLSKYAKACHLNNRHDEAERVLGVVKRLFGEDMYHIANREVYGELMTN